MQIADLLTPERVQTLPEISSKKKLLEYLGKLLARDLDLPARQIYESLYQRELQGNTGLGRGVAIPHGKLQDAPEDAPLAGALIKLDQPLEFDAPDQQPVDLVMAIVVPESACQQHQQALQHLAEQLQDSRLQEKIRQTEDAATLYDLLASWAPEDTQNA